MELWDGGTASASAQERVTDVDESSHTLGPDRQWVSFVLVFGRIHVVCLS